MRCPKCQYLGFDGQSRCRNCGYDFSLSNTLPAVDPGAVDIARPASAGDDAGTEPGELAADLPLRPEPTARERARAAIRQRQASSRTPGIEAFDLPLFEGAPEPRPIETRPLVTPSPTPRPPLSVRRATVVDVPRSRGGAAPAAAAPAPVASAPALDLDALPLSLAPERVEPEVEQHIVPSAPAPAIEVAKDADRIESKATADATDAASAEPSRAASIGARLTAGLIDALLLGAVDLVVVAFTLRLTSVPWSQITRLPFAPLLAFLALLATAYLTMFTVLAGQTAGKMVSGIRVVEVGGRPVRFGHAVLRAVVQVLTVPLLGVGFLPALLAADRRALYDRLSETEVIRSDA